MRHILIVTLIFVVQNVFSADIRVDPLVRISQGLVRGLRSNEDDYSYFLGIPYAQVDMDNPFGPSQPHPGFGNEIFNAYDGTIQCPQREWTPLKVDLQTLDCLVLNIYVPFRATTLSPLPVLVYIHGGGFEIGAGTMGDPKDLVNQGIVVVTINYRLGPYGFMCLDIPSVPGNQGLKDQYDALRWVQDNIAAFGGNPYQVTIGGGSAGSCSVLLHLFSPKERLFNRLIAQSGTPQSYGMFVNGDVDAAKKLAQHLGFNTTDTQEAVDFLSNSSPDLVVAAYVEANLDLKPCKERSFSGVENFVETDPYSMSNERNIRNTPIIIGHNALESSSNTISNNVFYDYIRANFNLDESKLIEAANTVRHFYIGDEPISDYEYVTDRLLEFDADFVFNHPTQRIITALLNDRASPVYEYLYSYVGEGDRSPAGHGAEFNYLFSSDSNRNEDDQLIASRITTLWANFVKYGNPTPAVSDLLPVTWTPVSSENRPYLLIDTDMHMESRIFQERMAFWDLFYSFYGQSHNLRRQCSMHAS